MNLDKISIGCVVKVYDVEFEEEMEFKLVGSTEANSLQNKISNESPVGHALIGQKVGEWWMWRPRQECSSIRY